MTYKPVFLKTKILRTSGLKLRKKISKDLQTENCGVMKKKNLRNSSRRINDVKIQTCGF